MRLLYALAVRFALPFGVLALSAAPAAAQWVALAPMPTPRAGTAVGVLDGQVYVIGGRNASNQVVGTVERYDPATNTWSGAPSLDEPRRNAAAVVVGGRLVVTGGRDGDGRVTDDCEVFDPADDRWESFSNLDEEREGHAVFVVDGVAYAFGGTDESELFRGDAEEYDPSDGNWRGYASWTLAVPRASFGAAPLGGGVVVVGGYSAFGPLADVEYYVPGQDGTMRAPLPEARGGLAAATLPRAGGPRVYALGGRNGANAVVARVDVYDPAADAWAAGPPLPAPRERMAAVAVGPTLYVFGGRGADGGVVGTTYALDVSTPAEEGPAVAAALALTPPAPNPSSGPVRLALRLDAPEAVRAEVFDALGRRVAVLHDGALPPGTHPLAWDGRLESGGDAPAGVYVVRVRAGARQAVRPVTVVR